jgi:lipoprotein NlpI
MRNWMLAVGAALLCGLILTVHGQADGTDDLLKSASEAMKSGKVDEALDFLNKAAAADPNNARVFLLRGGVHEFAGHHKEAIGDFDKAIALDAKLAEAYDQRGSERFKIGDIAGSLADFDKFLELEPKARAGHWKRGITCYYAGKFEEGAKQFKGYEDVDTNDVENAVWHYLCVARMSSVEKARSSLLKIGNDRRVPMMQVYALFAGKMKPEDVLAAVKEGKPGAEELNKRLFYAELYLGLYWEVEGDKKKALEHLSEATEHKIGHYMWDVARVHHDLLKKELKP